MYRFAQAFAVLGNFLWLMSALWERLNLKDRPTVRLSKRPVQRAREDGSGTLSDERSLLASGYRLSVRDIAERARDERGA